MIFEKLADGIMKHSKLIIAAWIVILICSVPFIMKAGSVLDYDTSDMAGNDSESAEGFVIINKYFASSDVNVNEMDLLLVLYDTDTEHETAIKLSKTLTDNMGDYTFVYEGTEYSKLSMIFNYGDYENTDKSGVLMLAISYSEDALEHLSVSDDTGNLRGWVSGMVTESGAEDLKTLLTGSPAITYDTEQGAAEDVSHIDIFSVLLILILVGLFFRSIVSSAMPPITIGVALGIAFCLLFFIGHMMDIFFITEMFIMVSMLGAGCDYCIFILARYREERRKGKDHDSALKESIMWAGESIATSGLSVMIGFGAMSICSFSMISTMGIMLAIGIFIALMAALFLITSILNLMGERIFWPSKIDSFREEGGLAKGWYGKCAHFGNRYFVRSAKFSIKHAKAIVCAAVLFTVPMAYVVTTSETSYDMIGTMLTGDSGEGLNEIENYTYGGMIMPDYEVIEFNQPIAFAQISNVNGQELGYLKWTDTTTVEKIGDLTRKIAAEDDNVGYALGLFMWSDMRDEAVNAIDEWDPAKESNSDYLKKILYHIGNDKDYPQIVSLYLAAIGEAGLSFCAAYPNIPIWNDNTYTHFPELADYILNYTSGSLGGTVTSSDSGSQVSATFVKITAVTKEQAMSDRSMGTLNTLKTEVEAFADDNRDIVANTWLTGTSAVMYEISEQVGSEFVKVIALAVLLIFILLFFVMKSYLTPLRSILTILMSVIWTIAITHLLFGNLLGDGVIWLIPIVLIVICLGLGMDYDILLTTRIKENRLHRGMSNDEAISEAVINTGSVITICGLIMGGAFGTLMLSSMTLLTEFVFALAFAILVDALIVRTYVVPAVMHLMGDWCWKGPRFLHRNDKV